MDRIPALGLIAVLALAACSEPGRPTTGANGTLNENSTLTQSTSDRPGGRADGEAPETGTNTGRPDSPRDLQPGTDGNTNPPTP
jgi:hypothetical protein